MDFLIPLEPDTHPLLDARSPPYSHATVRRAFIVWLRCGQTNEFRDVCNYFHYLEAMEDQLPADIRASSRHHEFSLFVTPPPTSDYQQELFPNLYTSLTNTSGDPYIQNYQIAAVPVKIEEIKETYAKIEGWKVTEATPQEIFESSQVFKVPANSVKENSNKLEVSEFLKKSAEAVKKEEIKKMNELNKACRIKPYKVDEKIKGTSKQDIVETSEMIKNYCKEQQEPLRNFLENFKEYATRCELTNTVNNVGFYIKRKMIHAELTLEVMVHRAKYNNGVRTGTKSPVKPSETTEVDGNENLTSQTKMKPVAKIAALNLKNNSKNILVTKIETKDSENIAFNEDLMTFDNNTTGQAENVITLLRRENGLKTTAGFSNLHNIAKVDILKCRKI